MKALVSLVALLLALPAVAQEITLEEVRVEAVLISPLELPLNRTIDTLVERLRLKDEEERERTLGAANKSSLTTVLELARYIPIPLGESTSRTDLFLRENYMRADLNPREKKSLFERR